MKSIICPVCGADLIDMGITRVNTYACDFKDGRRAFDDGIFDSEVWECPECQSDITDMPVDGDLVGSF